MANDWKEVWQGQEPEGPRIVAEVLRSRAMEAERVQKGERIGQSVRIAALIALAVGGIFAVDLLPQKIVLGATVIWNLFCLLPVWHGLRRKETDVGVDACVAFCRAELERRRHMARAGWITQAGPVLLFIAAIAYPGLLRLIGEASHITRVAPFLLLLALWLCAIPLIRRSQLRKIDREIEELRSLERAAGG